MSAMGSIAQLNPGEGLNSGILSSKVGGSQNGNSGIDDFEIEGGVYLPDLPEGARLEVKTGNHVYLVAKTGIGVISVSGHPIYCPHPVEVRLGAPGWGEASLKSHYIGPGRRLEFWHPQHDLVTTSRIRAIRRV